MELAKNQEHTVTIEGYGEGGMGVARIDGRVVFVHGALRGEKCRVLILKTLKSVAFAKVLEVIEPSSERITPDCPYFPRCGVTFFIEILKPFIIGSAMKKSCG
mgnify:CR=1 FL=1